MLRNLSQFQRRQSSFQPIRTDRPIIKSNSLTCAKNPKKTWKFVKNASGYQKRLGVYFLEIFAADTKSLKVKRFTSKKLVILSEETQFIWADSDRRVDNYEVKVWSILKFIKNLKNCLRFFGVHSLELFAADTRCFQVKTLSSK